LPNTNLNKVFWKIKQSLQWTFHFLKRHVQRNTTKNMLYKVFSYYTKRIVIGLIPGKVKPYITKHPWVSECPSSSQNDSITSTRQLVNIKWCPKLEWPILKTHDWLFKTFHPNKLFLCLLMGFNIPLNAKTCAW
jgi:hypothetical protein